MADEHDPSGTSDPKPFQVPAPMEEGDPRTVPQVNSPHPDATPAEPRKAVTEEEQDRADLPEGMEYVSDDDNDGVKFTTLPWPGY